MTIVLAHSVFLVKFPVRIQPTSNQPLRRHYYIRSVRVSVPCKWLTAPIAYANLNLSSLLQSLMGSQSTAKTIFLLASMVGWLIVGAALMYLSPWIADRVVSSDLTHLWMKNLSRGGYNPMLAGIGGSIALVATVVGNLIWHQQFDGKI